MDNRTLNLFYEKYGIDKNAELSPRERSLLQQLEERLEKEEIKRALKASISAVADLPPELKQNLLNAINKHKE